MLGLSDPYLEKYINLYFLPPNDGCHDLYNCPADATYQILLRYGLVFQDKKMLTHGGQQRNLSYGNRSPQLLRRFKNFS